MAHTASLITDNIRYLEQALTLLRALDDDAFTHTDPPRHTGSIGAHLRHNLDHYRSLLDGFDTHIIDYDARERDVRIEIDREYAATQIHHTIQRLRQLGAPDGETALLVKMDCGDETAQWARSTLARELEFLVSHTVHHYALIAIIARLQGIAPDAEFGVAPSTLRYQRQQLACAPQAG